MGGKEVQGEFEPECLGPCGAQDTFHVARLNRLGLSANLHRDLCKAGFAKLHDCKTPIMAADLETAGSCPSTRRTAPYRSVFSPIAAPNSAAPTAATNANPPSLTRTSTLPPPAIPPCFAWRNLWLA